MVSNKLKALISSELEISDIQIDELTIPNQLPGWDSLRHVAIITRIEVIFGVKLKMIEILRCKNIGDLQRLIDSKKEYA